MTKEIIIKIRSYLAPLFNGDVTTDKSAMAEVPRGYVNGEWYDGQTIFFNYNGDQVEAGYFADDGDFRISYYPIGYTLNEITDYLIARHSPILVLTKGELTVTYYNPMEDEDCPWDLIA